MVEVPADWFIRPAIRSRTYLYRIAVPRHNFHINCFSATSASSAVPVVTELNRVHVVLPPFYPHLVQSATKTFLGTWNFRTFSKPADDRFRVITDEDCIKTVHRISLTRVNNFTAQSYCIDPLAKETEFYDFHIEGSGFLRRQVIMLS